MCLSILLELPLPMPHFLIRMRYSSTVNRDNRNPNTTIFNTDKGKKNSMRTIEQHPHMAIDGAKQTMPQDNDLVHARPYHRSVSFLLAL